MMKKLDYPFTVPHLSKEEGGGYLIEFPNLPGCMSDGETLEETIKNGVDAVRCWIEADKKADGHKHLNLGSVINSLG